MCKNNPKLLFKYRALFTKTDLIRTIDIIEQNRLYMPRREQINDPLEFASTDVNDSYYLLSELAREHELEDQILGSERNKYRLLSLSADCFSPPMWAYYCNVYNGIVLCYSTDKHFSIAKEVNYISNRPHPASICAMPDIIEKDLFLKQAGWNHEKEWRIVRKSEPCSEEDSPYFDYDADELVAIIFGHCLDDETKRFVNRYIPNTIPRFRTYPGLRSYRLFLVPDDYEIDISGLGRWFKDVKIVDTNGLYDVISQQHNLYPDSPKRRKQKKVN